MVGLDARLHCIHDELVDMLRVFLYFSDELEGLNLVDGFEDVLNNPLAERIGDVESNRSWDLWGGLEGGWSLGLDDGAWGLSPGLPLRAC